MENKLNIAELLKDCPKGMELDCTICNGVKFIELDRNPNFPIVVRANNGYEFTLTKYGQIHNIDDAKCVIFPKGKDTWEGFQKPFKDGDVVATNDGDWIGITTGGKSKVFIPTYCVFKSDGTFKAYLDKKETWQFDKLATEEERQKLFKAIKDNGYKWNAETKTLEKLDEPKFKVGDKVLWNYDTEIPRVISKVELTSTRGYVYWIDCDGCSSGWWSEDELTPIPDKFDITTLKPFDKVLVRDNVEQKWIIDFFGFMNNDKGFPFVCVGHYVTQCIPYEKNEHLLGSNNDCDDFYKTWE